MSAIRYTLEADKALEELYSAANQAVTTLEKIEALECALQENSNYYAFGGEMSEDIKLGCLEYEYLSNRGLIELLLA